mgnify:CR=1 FL=1
MNRAPDSRLILIAERDQTVRELQEYFLGNAGFTVVFGVDFTAGLTVGFTAGFAAGFTTGLTVVLASSFEYWITTGGKFVVFGCD